MCAMRSVRDSGAAADMGQMVPSVTEFLGLLQREIS